MLLVAAVRHAGAHGVHGSPFAVVYAVLPVLIWAAFVGGTQAVTLAGVGVAFAADWAAITGRADRLLAPSPAGVQLVFIQIFLAVTLLTGMTLAV